MRFFAAFALLASTMAIKLSTTHTHAPEPLWLDLLKIRIHQAGEHSEEEIIAWLREEAGSENGLTWDELKAKV